MPGRVTGSWAELEGTAMSVRTIEQIPTDLVDPERRDEHFDESLLAARHDNQGRRRSTTDHGARVGNRYRMIAGSSAVRREVGGTDDHPCHRH